MSTSGEKRPVAVITGAGTGIGRAAAIALANRGWNLVLAGRRPEPLEDTADACLKADAACRPMPMPTDVSDAQQCRRLIDETVAAFDRLDALINNAGGGPVGPVSEATPNDISESFTINAFAPAWLIHFAWPTFERQGAGCVINVSSMAAHDPFPGLFAYGAAKAACESMIRSVRNERGELAIRAFGVAPGAVETDLLRSYFDESIVPRSATMTPDDIARVIVACACGEMDDRDGQTIMVSEPLPQFA